MIVDFLTFSKSLHPQSLNRDNLNHADSACSAITQEALMPTLSHASHLAKHPSHLGPIRQARKSAGSPHKPGEAGQGVKGGQWVLPQWDAHVAAWWVGAGEVRGGMCRLIMRWTWSFPVPKKTGRVSPHRGEYHYLNNVWRGEWWGREW